MRARAALALGATAAALGTVLLARRADRRWAEGVDPSSPADRILPAGEFSVVTTDDGAALAVTVSGDGPTVVLAHCWMGGRETWSPVAHRLLRSGHRVVLYDQRGHGSSTIGTDGLTIPRLGADLAAVLQAVDARDAVLAGHSMGGMTIQSLAIHHPDAFAAHARVVVLVATAAKGEGDTRAGQRAEAILERPWIEPVLTSAMGHALVRGVFGVHVHRNDLLLTRDLLVACPPSVRSGWFVAMAQMDLVEGIAGIGVPTTVLIGSRDTLTPPPRADAIVAAIPGAELQELPGYGHMLPLEAPDIVTAAIRRQVGASTDHLPG